jgi:uroporphyrin-III C-methyltransferase
MRCCRRLDRWANFRIVVLVNTPEDTPGAAAAVAAALPTPPAPPASARASRWPTLLTLLALGFTIVALAVAWQTQRRVKSLERELVLRQESSQRDAADARAAARTAQEMAQDASAKSALLDARVSDAAMQRSQVEELLQSVARSRDENVIADVEAAIRVALQQSALTGSAEPLVLTLKQADERLARYNQPRLDRVRRAIARDLERTRAQGAVDVATLAARLDDAVRLVDELPLLAVGRPVATGPAAASPAVPASPAATAAPGADDWRARATAWWRAGLTHVGNELRSLVRVTKIDHPESVLATPEQQVFLRENLKLRLLNARLALFSRQFDIAQSDLRDAQSVLDRYFDRSSKRVVAASDALRQVGMQSRQAALPRPDETLAALTTAAAGR